MVHIIAHRINKISELKNLDNKYGLELDLRDYGDRLLLAHDPFMTGREEDFDDFIKYYQHGTLILNIKSERIEERVKNILDQHNITDYFFLDSSFPMIRLLSLNGEKKIALRFSEFEGLDVLRNMQNKLDWVWVDCFSKLPINQEIYQEIKKMGYKLCLVSPDLQGRVEDINKYSQCLIDNKIIFDAICVKLPNLNGWENYLQEFSV